MEQWDLNLDFENIFNFVDKHDFLWTIDLWPILQESTNNLQSAILRQWIVNLLGETGIFFEKLDDAIC